VRPVRSLCPSMAAPPVLEVQFLQVMSFSGGNALPSGCEPVSMSCVLGVSPRPLTTAVAGGDGRRPGGGLSAQIGLPGARARSDRGGERLAMRVGAREAAQVAALARAGAGDEEAHALWRVRRVLRPGGGKSER
jgi:hypothetical protein